MGWISDAVDTVSDAIKEGFDAVTDVAGGVLDLVNDALDEVLGVLDLDIADADVASQAAGTLVTKTGAVVPLPVVYGRRGLGGTLIYMTTTGNKNKFLWLVYAIADGTSPASNFSSITLDEEVIVTDNALVASKYTGFLSFQYTLGDHTTQPFTDLQAADPNWTAEHLLLGTVAVALRLEWNQDVYTRIPTMVFYLEGAKIAQVEELPTKVQNANNLIDPSVWVVGTGGTQGSFVQNGPEGENNIILDNGPHGPAEPIWHCQSLDGGGDNADGGWNNNFTGTYDPTKAYRMTVWAKRGHATSGATYIGCSDTAGNTNDMFDVEDLNPYFWSGDLPVVNKWYLLVGLLHGSGKVGSTEDGVSGVYDPVTGTKVIDGTEFKSQASATFQTHRAYYYYADSAGDEQWLARPRVDLVDGSEPSLDGLMRVGVYSNNPADVLFDYLTNHVYGKGLLGDDGVDVDLTSFTDAKTYYDESVTSYFSGPTHKRMACDIVISTSKNLMDNSKKILQSCRSTLPYVNGLFYLTPEKHYIPADYGEASYFDFNMDNIIGGWSFKVGDVNTRFNRVKATFANEDIDYKPDFIAVESSVFRTEDNGKLLEKSMGLEGITNVYRAIDAASVIMRRSRQQIVVSFLATPEALQVKTGTVVTITHPTPGWTAKQFRVSRMKLMLSGNVSVTLAEHEETVYDLSVPNEENTSPDTNLPDISSVPDITGLTLLSDESVLILASDGTLITQIYVTWDEADNVFVNGYDVEYKRSVINLLEFPKEFDNAGWNPSNITVTANTNVAPDQTTTADTLEDASASFYAEVGQTKTIDITKRCTASVFVKKDAVPRTTRYAILRISFSTGGTTENNDISFDTSTSDFTISINESTNVQASCTSYSADWWLVEISATPTDQSNTVAKVRIFPAAGASSDFSPNDAATVGSIIVWNAQLFQGDSVWLPAGSPNSIINNELYIQNTEDGVDYDVRVRARNASDFSGAWTTNLSHTVVGKTSNPGDVSGLVATISKAGVRLSWNAVSDLDVAGYEIRVGGSSWGDGDAFVAQSDTTDYEAGVLNTASYTYRIKAFDTGGRYSDNEDTAVAVISNPDAPVMSHSFHTSHVTLTWPKPASTFTIAGYILSYDHPVEGLKQIGTVDTTSLNYEVDWQGAATFRISAIDAANNTGPEGTEIVTVALPVSGAVTAEVIDNNVLLRWPDLSNTLPIAKYELRKGATYAGSAFLFDQEGTFAALFESSAGDFTYWVTGVDTAGNAGANNSITTAVSEPPDYILQDDFTDDFSGGTKVNAAVDAENNLTFLVNTTETWADHFNVNNSFADIQDQIDAGYPHYIQPTFHYSDTVTDISTKQCTVTSTTGLSTGFKVRLSGMTADEEGIYTVASVDSGTTFTVTEAITDESTATIAARAGSSYQKTIDYGQALTNLSVGVNATTQAIDGNPQLFVRISVSDDDITYTDFPYGQTTAFVAEFRYVKVTLEVAGDTGEDLMVCTNLNIVVSTKEINDSGTATITATGGTAVTFNKSFLDVKSITVSPIVDGSAGDYTAIADFEDIPNPTGMEVRLYLAGTEQSSGKVGWSIKGF